VLLLLFIWWPAPGPTRVDTNITTLLRDPTGAWTLVWDISYAALVSAAVVTASPHFSRPFRLTGPRR